jgi:ATP-binding cassette, subfamily B, bacterial PglK
VILRALASLLDLVGIMLIGFLASSIALFLDQGSDPSRLIVIAGVELPAVTAGTLPWLASGIFILFVAKAGSSIFLTHRLAVLLAKAEAIAGRNIASKILTSGQQFSRRFSMGDVQFTVHAGSNSAFSATLNALGTITSEGFLFLLVVVVFFLVNPTAAIATLLYFFVIAVVIHYIIGRLMLRSGEEIASSSISSYAGLEDLRSVLREASLNRTQEFFLNKIYLTRLRASGSLATQHVLAGLPRHVIEIALLAAIALVVLFQLSEQDFASSAATLGVFLSGGLRLTAALLPLQSAMLTVQQSSPAAIKALDILETPQPQSDVKIADFQNLVPTQEPFSVELEDVSFEGSDKPTVFGLSMTILPGSHVAIIGPSGAGKSTIADLILGLLSPSQGNVLLGGVSPQAMSLNNPGILGYVPQNPRMVGGTILANIALGKQETEIDIDKINWAVKASNLTDLLETLPDGIHSNLGKHADQLSGGQLQRIGLARALYGSPRLLVLDEPTSGLDAASEREIQLSLESLRGQVTVVTIAHRLNTIQHAEEVFYIEEGRIVDKGKFKDLLERNNKVQHLVELLRMDEG